MMLSGGRAMDQESEALSLETSISLPNVKGLIDHFSVGVKGQRLFVAAVANHSVEVIDVKSGRRGRSLTGLSEPQGVFYDASADRLFVACGLDGVTKIFDGTTFQALASVTFPDDADNIRYDPRGKTEIVGYAGAKQLKNRQEGSGGLGLLDSNGDQDRRHRHRRTPGIVSAREIRLTPLRERSRRERDRGRRSAQAHRAGSMARDLCQE